MGVGARMARAPQEGACARPRARTAHLCSRWGSRVGVGDTTSELASDQGTHGARAMDGESWVCLAAMGGVSWVFLACGEAGCEVGLVLSFSASPILGLVLSDAELVSLCIYGAHRGLTQTEFSCDRPSPQVVLQAC